MTNENRITLEIAAASLEDCITAQAGGADRVELNSAMTLGGLTPSLGALLEVKAEVQIPVVAILRPRPGGFCYSSRELRVMHRDVDLMLEAGVNGIALGVLTTSGDIDVPRCKEFVTMIGKKCDAVFHRAFDVTPDPRRSLDMLIELGFKRVMTSGQQNTAIDGAALIGDMITRAAGRIEVMPASGINKHNVGDLLLMTGAKQVHASLRMIKSDDRSTAARPHVMFNGTVAPGETRYPATDPAAVAEMRKLLDAR